MAFFIATIGLFAWNFLALPILLQALWALAYRGLVLLRGTGFTACEPASAGQYQELQDEKSHAGVHTRSSGQ
jgi:hypothetical protein